MGYQTIFVALLVGCSLAAQLLDRPLEYYSKVDLLNKLEQLYSQCYSSQVSPFLSSNDDSCCPTGEVAVCIKCTPTTCGPNADCFVIDGQITCICRIGYTAIDNDPMNKGCRNSSESTGCGDPHYKTLDGSYYDYQGTCPYIYSKPCKNSGLDSYYVVKAKNKLFYVASPVSYVSDVQVEMAGEIIRIDEGMNLFVNEVKAFFPYYFPSKDNKKVSVELRGGYAFIVNKAGVTVTFARGYINIKVPQLDEFLGRDGVCGFAGNLNNNCTDDLVDIFGNGLIQPNCRFPTDHNGNLRVAKILDTWRTEEFGGFDPVRTPCETGGTIAPKLPGCDTTQSAKDCLPIQQAINGQGPFAACKVLGAERLKTLYESCAFDGCYIKGSKCQVFTEFVGQCQQAVGNANLKDWRAVTGCPMDCPKIRPFSTYEPCMSGCQPTCLDPNPTNKCNTGCHEGCKCSAGYVLDTSQNPPKCVKQQECPCFDPKGNSHPERFSWLSNNCKEVNVCLGGKIITQGYNCPENSSCGVSGGVMECVCNKGFKWDGQKKNCIKA
ncbi:hypothetical protein L596_000119 [Steinernema carpocapsae]|uniref:VWFD domain-containing protein n=1 Tax=Steinernema carpocapsae TaxID=34508 RepID=A0A4U8UH27_STECR|nr:hypothetical protein L596_000119 [Steinernema carpocapsae]